MNAPLMMPRGLPVAEQVLREDVERDAFTKDLYSSSNLFGHWNALRFNHRFIEEQLHSPEGRSAIIHAVVDKHPSRQELHKMFSEASREGKVAGYRPREANAQEETILKTIESQLGESSLNLAISLMRELDPQANSLEDIRPDALENEQADLRRLFEFSAQLLWENRYQDLHAHSSEHFLSTELNTIYQLIIGLRKTDGSFSQSEALYERAKKLYGTWFSMHQDRSRIHTSHAFRLKQQLDQLMTS